MHGLYAPDDEEALAFIAGGLLVTACYPVTLERSPTATVPLVLVDPAHRPDLLDLGRVVVQEQPGGGGVHTSWDLLAYDVAAADAVNGRPRGYVSLTLTMSAPVTSRLKLLFALPFWIEELERIAAAPSLVIALGPPNADGSFHPRQIMTLGNPGSHAHEVIRDAVRLVERWGNGDADRD
jgi:hypothetical protein